MFLQWTAKKAQRSTPPPPSVTSAPAAPTRTGNTKQTVSHVLTKPPLEPRAPYLRMIVKVCVHSSGLDIF